VGKRHWQRSASVAMMRERMRLVGLVVFLLGAGATGYAVRASFERPRAAAAAYGIVASVTVLVALAGLLLVFVPDFFS
jgi:hypothetical protein